MWPTGSLQLLPEDLWGLDALVIFHQFFILHTTYVGWCYLLLLCHSWVLLWGFISGFVLYVVNSFVKLSYLWTFYFFRDCLKRVKCWYNFHNYFTDNCQHRREGKFIWIWFAVWIIFFFLIIWILPPAHYLYPLMAVWRWW